jgi:hypothetical protein
MLISDPRPIAKITAKSDTRMIKTTLMVEYEVYRDASGGGEDSQSG